MAQANTFTDIKLWIGCVFCPISRFHTFDFR